MIKINIYLKAGHGVTISRGASGIIDEVDENRKVKNVVLKYLRQLGHSVTDVTQDNLDANAELVDGVNRANSGNADLFVSVHFNKAFNTYEGALGTECWVYSKSDNITLDEQVATRVVNALGGLGFKNRGVKESTEYYELKNCAMASVIVEVCFVEATEDVALYKKTGVEEIGRRIAYAIANESLPVISNTIEQNVISNAQPIKEEIKVDYIVQYSNSIDRNIAEIIADRINAPTIDCTRPYAFYNQYKTVIAVGEAKNKSSYTNVHIQGSNRAETLKKAIEWLESIGK